MDELQKGFETKNEQLFLNSFPDNFNQLVYFFGEKDSEEMPVVEQYAVDYINYWFDLIKKESNKEFESRLIPICEDGSWHEGNIEHFREKAITHVLQTRHYGLINNLDDANARSVLGFLLDEPEPALNEAFFAILNPQKREIAYSIFEIDFNWSLDGGAKGSTELSYYLNDAAYFTRDIDINLDGILDKIVCSEPYEGEELILFVKTKDAYERVLKTPNFSQDGGSQVVDILQTEEGFVVKTAFPDGGMFLTDSYIAYENNSWWVKNVVYTSKSDNSEDAFLYVCELPHNVELRSLNYFSLIKEFPDESERDKVCRKEKMQ